MPKYAVAFSMEGELIVEAETKSAAEKLLSRALETPHFNPRGFGHELVCTWKVSDGKLTELNAAMVQSMENTPADINPLEYMQMTIDFGEDFQ